MTSSPPQRDSELLEQCRQAVDAVRQQIGRVIVGQEPVLELMLVTLMARGHALLVGVPGLAKTLLVSSLGKSLGLSFGRVQFTPDLLPADITGTDVLDERERLDGRLERQLRFMSGPIFENLVLADEINRTPPKTQAALLQAMQERQITVGGATHPLPSPFQVFATRNPIEQEGTYSLPEAQLDRFLLEIHVDYPTAVDECDIARRTTSGQAVAIDPVLDASEVVALGDFVPRIPITDEAVELAVKLARATRPGDPGATREVGEYVRFGAGPRGSQALVLAAKALAATQGRGAADLDEVRQLAIPALRHRVVLGYRAEADGIRIEELLSDVLRSVGR